MFEPGFSTIIRYFTFCIAILLVSILKIADKYNGVETDVNEFKMAIDFLFAIDNGLRSNCIRFYSPFFLIIWRLPMKLSWTLRLLRRKYVHSNPVGFKHWTYLLMSYWRKNLPLLVTSLIFKYIYVGVLVSLCFDIFQQLIIV